MTKEWAEGAILPGAAGQGGAKQPHQDIFFTNEHNTEHGKVF